MQDKVLNNCNIIHYLYLEALYNQSFINMKISGNIRKMRSELKDVVQYYLPIGAEEVDMNALISHHLKLSFTGQINCVKCGRKTKKSFAQGFCYPCFISAPETEDCVLRPELCRAHEGVARDMEYAKRNCLSDQVVYLSKTSDVKVGVTRSAQVPFRWIDQGASQAIELARTPNRYTAGVIEVFLKEHMKDKTNWRKMLKNESSFSGLLEDKKREVIDLLSSEFHEYVSKDDTVWEIKYPVIAYPEKVSSLNFDKTSSIEGVLQGIKGQYLIFQDNSVLNIRKFGGYHISFES